MKITSAALSKPGGRDVNEDALGCWMPTPGCGCWVVADGQGRRGGGDIAAQKAVQALLGAYAAKSVVSDANLSQALQAAHRAITDMQAEIIRNQSLRVALAVLCADGRDALWAHIGDVRVYAFRDGELLALTKDHSVPQTLVNAGEISPAQIRGHSDSHRLLRSLGAPGTMQPTLLQNYHRLLPGDLFLICSDGFWQYVTELEMQADWCKSTSLEKWLEHMEMRLLQMAPMEHDNYCAIALLAEAGE
jgi:serine/threonine protein phosphatase PrpC